MKQGKYTSHNSSRVSRVRAFFACHPVLLMSDLLGLTIMITKCLIIGLSTMNGRLRSSSTSSCSSSYKEDYPYTLSPTSPDPCTQQPLSHSSKLGLETNNSGTVGLLILFC